MGYRFSAPVKRIEYQPPTGPRKAQAETGQRIVGRDEERSELRRAYERAQAGHGSLVCISGDVGLGKTALLDSFLDDLVQAGYAFNLARARSSEALTETEPFMPWIEALGALAREAAAAETMQKAAPTWHREISHTGNGDPRSMKRELLDFFREVSPVHPLIVMLDDFHWSDVDSVDLLSYLSTRLESTRVLIVFSYRLGEMRVNRHPFVAVRSELLTRHACKEIHLDCLKREDVQTHLSSAYSDYNFPEDYAGFLHAKTEGNPLFIRELARKPGELT
jgi:predicted ATPase